MSTESQNHDEGSWEPCPAGELQRLAGRLAGERRHRRLTTIGQWTVGATLSVVLLLAGAFVVGQFSQNNFGGIACREVTAQLVAYHAGELDAERAEQISAHLQQCSMCNAAYDEMISEPSDPAEAENAPRRRAPVRSLVATLAHTAIR